jgi:hypothetical protein
MEINANVVLHSEQSLPTSKILQPGQPEMALSWSRISALIEAPGRLMPGRTAWRS